MADWPGDVSKWLLLGSAWPKTVIFPPATSGTLGNPLRLTFEKLLIDNIDAISGYKGLDILDCLRH